MLYIWFSDLYQKKFLVQQPIYSHRKSIKAPLLHQSLGPRVFLSLSLSFPLALSLSLSYCQLWTTRFQSIKVLQHPPPALYQTSILYIYNSIHPLQIGSSVPFFFIPCCCCSVTKSRPTLHNPTDCSMPGFPVPHLLPEFTQVHELVMPSNQLILCHSLVLLPSTFPSIKVFSSELAACIRRPKYWSFSFSINTSNEYSGLISS